MPAGCKGLNKCIHPRFPLRILIGISLLQHFPQGVLLHELRFAALRDTKPRRDPDPLPVIPHHIGTETVNSGDKSSRHQ